MAKKVKYSHSKRNWLYLTAICMERHGKTEAAKLFQSDFRKNQFAAQFLIV